MTAHFHATAQGQSGTQTIRTGTKRSGVSVSVARLGENITLTAEHKKGRDCWKLSRNGEEITKGEF